MLPIDHVTVAGADLRRMQAALAAVGIETVYGGAHSDGATEMALVSFPDGTYLELIAPRPQPIRTFVERHPWSRFFKNEAGPCAWAVRTGDLSEEVRRLRSAGIAVSGATANGRQRPDGVRLEWETATPGADPAGSFFPFLIRDVTARDLRAFPQGAPGIAIFAGSPAWSSRCATWTKPSRDTPRPTDGPNLASRRIPDSAHNSPCRGCPHRAGAAADRRFMARVTPDAVRGSTLRLAAGGRRSETPRRGNPKPLRSTSTSRWFDSSTLGWRLAALRDPQVATC